MANLSDYIVNFTSLDTLNSVTGRGATTTNDITIGNLTSTGIDDNATSTAITIDASENVGIGTTSPVSLGAGYKNIDVRHTTGGGVTLGDASNIHAYLFSDNNGVTLQSPGSRSIKFTTVSTERMRIDSSGNVGIGTTSPDAVLHTAKTQASGDVPILLENSGTSGVATASLVFAGSGGSGAEKARIKSAVYGDGYMAFHTNDDSEKMRIDASGRVGIGMTANSGCLLNVNDHIRAENSAFLAGRETAALPAFAFHDDTDTGMFNVATNILAFSTGGTERMRIDSSGNVGIGVVPDSFNTVDGALQVGTRNTITSFSNDIGIGYNHYYNSGWKYANADVASRFSSTSSIPFLWQYAASGSADGAITWSEAMRIDSSGDVFIKGGGQLKIERSGASNFSSFYTDTGDSTIINNSWSNKKIVLTRDGNVGIGTTSPDERLEVYQGNIKLGTDTNTTSKLIFERSAIDRAEIYVGSANQLQFDVAGTERMRIDGSGNVGIGTSSPGALLEVNQNAENVIRVRSADGAVAGILFGDQSDLSRGSLYYSNSDESMQFRVNNQVEAVRIDSSGRVGIGMTNPDYVAVVSDATSATRLVVENTANGSAGSGVYMRVYSGGSLVSTSTITNDNVGNLKFFTGTTTASERMRINSSGNLLVGTTTAVGSTKMRVVNSTNGNYVSSFEHTNTSPYGIQVYYSNATPPNNTSNRFIDCEDTGGQRFQVRSNGGIANYQANDANLSDERAKKDIVLSESYLNKLCGIPVRNFRYKDQESNSKHHLGVIAQEVEAVAPEFVNKASWEHKDGQMDTVYNTDLMFAMMKSIQELSAQVDELKAEVAALKGE